MGLIARLIDRAISHAEQQLADTPGLPMVYCLKKSRWTVEARCAGCAAFCEREGYEVDRCPGNEASNAG